MDPLYFLEHQFLPAVVYPGPDGKQISPFLLGNGFGPLVLWKKILSMEQPARKRFVKM